MLKTEKVEFKKNIHYIPLFRSFSPKLIPYDDLLFAYHIRVNQLNVVCVSHMIETSMTKVKVFKQQPSNDMTLSSYYTSVKLFTDSLSSIRATGSTSNQSIIINDYSSGQSYLVIRIYVI